MTVVGVVEGDFLRLSRAGDDVEEGMQVGRNQLGIGGLALEAMPGGAGGVAFGRVIVHLEHVHTSIANAAADLSEAAYLAERDFFEADDVNATFFRELKHDLYVSPHDGYREV